VTVARSFYPNLGFDPSRFPQPYRVGISPDRTQTSCWVQLKRTRLGKPRKRSLNGLPDVVERVTDRPVFWPALMLIEVGLKLLFCFVGVYQKLLSSPEGQFANIAVPGARGAPNESGDFELSVRHRRHHGRAWIRSQTPSMPLLIRT